MALIATVLQSREEVICSQISVLRGFIGMCADERALYTRIVLSNPSKYKR